MQEPRSPALSFEGRPPVAFALDFATADEARAAAREVAPAIGMVKVGLELFVHAGPSIVGIGRDVGLPVFLDLKLHDIPETVERAVAQASGLGARLVTVHASGGRAMLRRAVTRAEREGGSLAICAVTVLTSLDDADLRDVGLAGSPADAALRLARVAWDEGVRWFVCSPAEVRALRAALGEEAVLVTPGVRPSAALPGTAALPATAAAGAAASGAGAAASSKGDQKRVATPEQAIADGASFVVVGRPIRDAADRLAAARAIAESISRAGAAGGGPGSEGRATGASKGGRA